MFNYLKETHSASYLNVIMCYVRTLIKLFLNLVTLKASRIAHLSHPTSKEQRQSRSALHDVFPGYGAGGAAWWRGQRMLSTLCGSHLQHSAVCSPRYLTHSQMMAQTVNQLGLLRCATQGIKTKHLALLKCSNASSQASEHQANFRSSSLGTVPQAGHSQGKSRLQQA